MGNERYTVVEHHGYFRKARKLMTEQQMTEVVDIVSKTPEIGDVMAGTGGIRKFRYAAKEGRGKSAGARVIYLAVLKKGLIHMIDIFGKNEKINLTQAEKNEITKLTTLLKGD
jgi:hypothetical protein